MTLEIKPTRILVMYTGDRKDIKNKIGELYLGLENKHSHGKWVFKAIEGLEREPVIVHPINISFLEKHEIDRLKLKLSSTKISSNHKKRKAQDERRFRQSELD